MTDWVHPDEVQTPVEDAVHHPIGRTVRSMRQQIWLALLFNALALVGLAGLVYYQGVTLGAWRQRGRDLQIEILEHVRSVDHKETP